MSTITTRSTVPSSKRSYDPPALKQYGTVRDLTANGSGKTAENDMKGGGCVANATMKLCPSASDRRLKDTIVRLGQHKQGFGLYLFNYRPEFQGFGSGRQFGVMADEVAAVRPDAVFVGPDGYQRVDYAALGISRVLN